MAFDPDAYLATKTAPAPAGFDPDAYLKAKAPPKAGDFSQQYEENAVRARIKDRRGREAFMLANAQPGTPLDLDQSLPAGIRARLSLEGNIDKQLQLLDSQPGILGTRKAKDNSTLIATIQGEDGKPRDVLLNPKSFSAGDIAGNAGNIAKAIGAGAVAFGTSGASLLPQAAAMFGTTAALNATMEGGSRLAAGQDLDPKQLALASAGEGALNAALPLAGAAVKPVARALAYPFRMGAGALEREAVAAGARQGVPLTAAQRTGSGVLARSTDLPGTGGGAALAAQQDALRVATDRAIGPSGRKAVLAEADVASRVKPILAAEYAGAEAGVDAAKNTAARAAQTEIKAALDAGITPSNKTNSDVGSFIRNAVAGPGGRAEAFRAQAAKEYEAVHALANAEGVSAPTAPITALKNDIGEKSSAALLELAPGIKKIGNIEAILTAVPEGAAAPVPLTLKQAIEMRAVVNDSVASGVAPGEAGVPNAYLKRLAEALTESIDQGVASGSKDLQAAYQTAKTNYAKNITPLQQSDVAKLFLKTDSAGRLGDDEIVTRLFSGKGNLDALRAYKGVLGEKSPEYKLLLRQGVNDMMGAPGPSGMIDAESFLRRLNSMTPEMQAEVLGPTAKAVTGNARLMATARGAKIPAEELEDALLSSPGTAPRLLQSAIDREAAVAKQYNTGILEKLRNGTIAPKTLNEDRFVSDFVPNASVADVRQVLTSVGAKSPETVDAFRQRTLVNILDDVAGKAPMDAPLTGGNIPVDFDKIAEKYLGADADKYRAIIGEDGMQFLRDLGTLNKAIASSELKAQGAKPTAANLASHVAGAAVPGDMGLVRQAVRAAATAPEFILGNAQRFQAVRDFLSTGRVPQLGRGLTNTKGAILSAPAAVSAGSDILSGKEEPAKRPPLAR